MNQPRVDITKNALYSASLYFLHSRKNFYTHPLEEFYIVRDHIDVSFLFLLQKDFYIAHEYIGAFYIFFFRIIWYLSRGYFRSFSFCF